MPKDNREEYQELRKSYEELETSYLLEREEHRKARNHLMSILNSRSFKTGRAIFFIPHYAKEFARGNKNKLKCALKKIYKLNTKGSIVVGIITRDGTVRPTSSAFLRLISPLSYGEAGKKIITLLLPDNTKTVTEEIDLCIVQRTAVDNLGAARTLVKDLRDKKIKLVIDTDDNFSGLDTDHPQHVIHSESVDALNYLKQHADRVWVSTDKLALDYKSKRTVFRNSVENRLWRIQKHTILSGKKINAVYMGTGTHDKDLAMVLPIVDAINSKYNNLFELTLFGVTTKKLPNNEWLHFKPTNMMYPDFVNWYQKQGPFDIGLAPLENTDFNKAKSDIKVLDYLCTGVLPVVSDIDPYRNPELDDYVVRVGYESNDWYKTLEDIIQNRATYIQKKSERLKEIERYLFGDRSVEHISNQMISEINEIISEK